MKEKIILTLMVILMSCTCMELDETETVEQSKTIQKYLTCETDADCIPEEMPPVDVVEVNSQVFEPVDTTCINDRCRWLYTRTVEEVRP